MSNLSYAFEQCINTYFRALFALEHFGTFLGSFAADFALDFA